MLRKLAVTALLSAAVFACKGKDSKAPGSCESGYVLTQQNVCVLQNIVDYNQCVENAAARESINVGLTREILGRLQLQWVGPNIGPTPDARAKAAKFIELYPGSCRELEVVWGCYQVANKVQEAATEPPICTPAAAGAPPAGGSTPPAGESTPPAGDAPK
jgi:hypothetical protein